MSIQYPEKKNKRGEKDKVVTQEREVFKCVSLFMEFQFASLETVIGMQDVSHTLTNTHSHTRVCILYPELTLLHALCRQTPSHFQLLLYLSPCARLFFFISASPLFRLRLPLSHHVCNQVQHCLGYFHTFLTSVCLPLPLTPSPLSPISVTKQ